MWADTGRLHRVHVVAPNFCSASRSSGTPQPGQWTASPSGGRDGVMRCRRGGVGIGDRPPPGAAGPPPTAADEMGVARRERPRAAAPSTCGTAVAMRNCRSRGDIPERSSADTMPCLTRESPAAAGIDAASASTRDASSAESEMSDRSVRPTHLMRPHAMPISAIASAPYLKLAATRKGKGSHDAPTDRRGRSPPGDRRATVRSLDASRGARVMRGRPARRTAPFHERDLRRNRGTSARPVAVTGDAPRRGRSSAESSPPRTVPDRGSPSACPAPCTPR